MNLQVPLEGKLVRMIPSKEEHFEALYQVAADPAVWALHPEKNRSERDVFRKYFAGALESGGAYTVYSIQTGEVVGCTRYNGLTTNSVEIGYTFVGSKFFGKGHNTEMKQLMIVHAFKSVEKIHFYIGEENVRSRRAVEKLGAKYVQRMKRKPLVGEIYYAVEYILMR